MNSTCTEDINGFVAKSLLSSSLGLVAASALTWLMMMSVFIAFFLMHVSFTAPAPGTMMGRGRILSPPMLSSSFGASSG